ncbi:MULTISPECIES: hypothetical protein [unclassified Afipia]|nr:MULTISPECIES: hypothetical protein [unclassified Afipia]
MSVISDAKHKTDIVRELIFVARMRIGDRHCRDGAPFGAMFRSA